MKQLFDMLKRGNHLTFYEEIFPNEFVEDSLVIRSDGNPAAGFYLSLPEKDMMGEDEILYVQDSLEKAMSRLPSGTVVHIQSQFYHTGSNLYELNGVASGFITTKLRDYLGDRPLLHNRVVLYLIFNFTGENPKNPLSTFFANLARRFGNPMKDLERNKALAAGHIQTFLTQLNTIKGIHAMPMNDLDLTHEKLRYFSLKFDKVPQAFDGTIHNRGSEVKVGDEILRVVFMRRTGNQLYHLIRNDRDVPAQMFWTMGHFLSFPHLVNFSMRVCDSEKEMRTLEILRNIRKALGSMQKQIDRMIIRDIEDFTQEVREQNKRLVYINHNVMTWNQDADRLSLQVDMVKTAYTRANGSIGLAEAYNTGNYFFTYGPGGALDMFSTLLMPVDEAILHFDFSTPTTSESKGIILCNRELEPVLVDLWSDKFLPNKNRLTIGVSGSGKSFAMNAILAQELDQGVEIVILDVGGSYKNLYNLNKGRGRYYEYNLQSSISFNPFLIGRDRHGHWNLTEDKVVFLLTFITILWKDTRKGETLSKEEESVVTRLLSLYFEEVNRNRQVIPRLDRFVTFVKSFAAANKGHADFEFFNIDSFALVLEKFTQGTYARAVNSDDNENISGHQIVVFDLAGIQSDPILYPVLAIIIVELVLDKVRSNPKLRKEIVIDEAWTMLQGGLSSFIEYLYRTIRKSNGAVTIVSQGIIELKTSPVGAAIKANAATRILLDHSSQQALIPDLQEFLGLTNHEVELLKSIRSQANWRDIMLIRGPVAQVFSVDVGPYASAAFSSWSQDRADIARLTKVGGPEYAINQFVEDKRTIL